MLDLSHIRVQYVFYHRRYKYIPQSVFPRLATLREGFHDMREWNNAIEIIGSSSCCSTHEKESRFNSLHHWSMYCIRLVSTWMYV
jgi:hypothetical protein